MSTATAEPIAKAVKNPNSPKRPYPMERTRNIGIAAHIDAGRQLRRGPQEAEIRACAVVACEELSARLGVAPRTLDSWLWNRGQGAVYKARPRHRCRCVFY